MLLDTSTGVQDVDLSYVHVLSALWACEDLAMYNCMYT